MAARTASVVNGDSLDAELNDIITSNSRQVAALCAAACRARVEEARREERAQILAAGGQSVPAFGPPSLEEAVWTRGFFDEKLKACGPTQQVGRSSRASIGADASLLATLPARGEITEECEFSQILRNAFAIRDAMHAALASSEPEPGREQKVRTCDLKTIVGKVHALWQDRWLEDSEEEGPSVKSSDQPRWKSASEKPASRRASYITPPRRPSTFMQDRAKRKSLQGDLKADALKAQQRLQDPAGFGGLTSNSSRLQNPRASCPPAMRDVTWGVATPAEHTFTPSLDRIEDVVVEASLASPRSPPTERSSPVSAPASAMREPCSQATQPAPRSARGRVAEGSTDLGKTLAELTALLQDANIIGPSSPGAGRGTSHS